MENFNPNLYDILGRISRSSSYIEIKTAYRTLAKLYHADKNLNDLVAADERMKELNEAYAILSKPETRARYDASLIENDELIKSAEAEKNIRQEEEKKRKVQEKQKTKYTSYTQRPKSTTSGSEAIIGVILTVSFVGLFIASIFSKKS